MDVKELKHTATNHNNTKDKENKNKIIEELKD